MSEFEKTISSEDLSSLMPTSEIVSIPIRTKSSSNVIDMVASSTPVRISPRKKFYSMDDIFDASVTLHNAPLGIMSDCVPSPSSGSSYASSSGSNSSSGSSSSPTCEISLLERLIRTHPLWFLPSLQRSGALHLLQGREVGNFIVRSSTQPKTMAVSVKLPGNLVEHYLLRAMDNRITLENSPHSFETVHQLIAHYCTTSDEIPVCLRVPSAIAEATSRQQLRSLALLGQEFWSIASNGSGKELSSPSDIETSKNFVSSGLGSQSSSSQNSLCDTSRKPLRPTTLELGNCSNSTDVGGVLRLTTATPPPVPLRWSRSALLSPMSQPSSVQSTPSEIQSTFSEKSGRPGKKKKRNSGNKAESIHYKDTEILDLFKGTKTVYDDKASDYEDIWSPQYYERSHTPRLSTFKPDLIPSSITPEVDNGNSNLGTGVTNQNSLTILIPKTSTPVGVDEESIIHSKNTQNHRLSVHGLNGNFPETRLQYHRNSIEDLNKQINRKGLVGSTKEDLGLNNGDEGSRKSDGIYTEPVDSLSFIRLGNGNRNLEPTARWSQPALSLLKLDATSEEECRKDRTGNGNGKSTEVEQKNQVKQDNNLCRSFHESTITQESRNITHRSSLADVSLTNKSGSQMCASRINSTTSGCGPNSKITHKKHTVTCASVDNLCHLRDIGKKSKQLRAVERETKERSKHAVSERSVPVLSPMNVNAVTVARPQDELNPVDSSNNRAWRLDNSWEFAMWQQKEEERRLMDNVAKFPIPTPPNSPGTGIKRARENLRDNSSSICSQNDDSLSSNNSRIDCSINPNRFSRYDNLEVTKTADEDNSSEDCLLDGEGEEKISTPWDSSKWEHLLRLVSESTQQLDSLQMTENPTNRTSSNFNSIERTNTGSIAVDDDCRTVDSIPMVTKLLDVSGGMDKAGKAVGSVVRELANKDNGVFGPTLKSFISCTIAAKVQDPHKVMRNIRQFISGMKNYLVGVNAESNDLRKEIKKQTETLSDCEFLNIDAILEEVLVDLVISPLHGHIRGLIDGHNAKHGDALKISPRPSMVGMNKNDYPATDVQQQETVEKLRKIYLGFEDSVSPMKKLDRWNEFVCQVQEMENYSTESFLPLLSEMLGSVCSTELPSHVDYMIGLLPVSLAEQNNYSLSLLQSAVSTLKTKNDTRKGSASLNSVRVLVPDERNGTLIRKVVPVRDSTTNKEVAKMVASKLGIVNPMDYILVTIKNGEEKICPESDLVYNFMLDGGTALAYKRLDAKIGWPQKIS